MPPPSVPRANAGPAVPAAATAARRSVVTSLLLSLRPHQWTKNALVFAGLIFAQRLRDLHDVEIAVAAFAVFCALSSVVYLVNDLQDHEADRLLPLKSKRPIASGALPAG